MHPTLLNNINTVEYLYHNGSILFLLQILSLLSCSTSLSNGDLSVFVLIHFQRTFCNKRFHTKTKNDAFITKVSVPFHGRVLPESTGFILTNSINACGFRFCVITWARIACNFNEFCYSLRVNITLSNMPQRLACHAKYVY